MPLTKPNKPVSVLNPDSVYFTHPQKFKQKTELLTTSYDSNKNYIFTYCSISDASTKFTGDKANKY